MATGWLAGQAARDFTATDEKMFSPLRRHTRTHQRRRRQIRFLCLLSVASYNIISVLLTELHSLQIPFIFQC